VHKYISAECVMWYTSSPRCTPNNGERGSSTFLVIRVTIPRRKIGTVECNIDTTRKRKKKKLRTCSKFLFARSETFRRIPPSRTQLLEKVLAVHRERKESKDRVSKRVVLKVGASRPPDEPSKTIHQSRVTTSGEKLKNETTIQRVSEFFSHKPQRSAPPCVVAARTRRSRG
jgi:hypothetical protein